MRPPLPPSVAIKIGAAALTLAALLGAGAAMQGCNYAAAADYIIEGPPGIPAAYDGLEKGRKTVIFIDDRANIVPRRSLRRAIGEAAESELIGQSVLQAENVIPSEGALFATAQEKRSDALSVSDLGRKLGAEVVIYVDMRQFMLSRDGASYQPSASAFIKVIDATNNHRVWPDSGVGHPLAYMDPDSGATLPNSSGEKVKAEDRLARLFGREVARAFFEHKKDYASDKREDAR